MRKRKKVPTFWWDMQGHNRVIVESDSDKYPCVGVFHYNPTDGAGCAEGAIRRAESLIEDLRAGRCTPVYVPTPGVTKSR